MRRGNNKACGPTTCSFSGLAKNKHWENYSCIEAHKAGQEIGDVTQRDHVTHLKKRPTRIHPKTLLNSHFICMGAPAPRHLRLVAVPGLPHGLVRPGHTHWMRCGGRDHISQLLRSHTEPSRSTLQTPHQELHLSQMHLDGVFSPWGAAHPRAQLPG